MPLSTKMFSTRSRAARDNDKVRALQIVSPPEEPQYNDLYAAEGYEEEMMDGRSFLKPLGPKSATIRPVIPQRSARRASRISESTKPEPRPFKQENDLKDVEQEDMSDPHQRYLSSEEDVSESADDYDESLLDLDDESTRSRSSSLEIQEHTARLVSFMFVGKPLLIEISIKKPKQRSREPKPRPTALRLDSNSSFRLPLLTTPPLRQETAQDSAGSRPSFSATSTESETRSIAPLFLESDPCATAVLSETSGPRSPTPTVLKTPSIANTAWKSVHRTLSLSKSSRRRPSTPFLSVYDESSPLPDKMKDKEVRQSYDSGKDLREVEPKSERAPVIYEDVMRGATKTLAAPVKEERQLKQKMSMFGLGRRKSVKLLA